MRCCICVGLLRRLFRFFSLLFSFSVKRKKRPYLLSMIAYKLQKAGPIGIFPSAPPFYYLYRDLTGGIHQSCRAKIRTPVFAGKRKSPMLSCHPPGPLVRGPGGNRCTTPSHLRHIANQRCGLLPSLFSHIGFPISFLFDRPFQNPVSLPSYFLSTLPLRPSLPIPSPYLPFSFPRFLFGHPFQIPSPYLPISYPFFPSRHHRRRYFFTDGIVLSVARISSILPTFVIRYADRFDDAIHGKPTVSGCRIRWIQLS